MSFDPLFDPGATPEEIDALREKVRRDPEAAETAARLIYVDGLLWSSARKKAARSRRWPWMLVAGGAAAAALLVALLVRSPSGARLENEKGAVAFDGESVRTSGERSAATVAYPDGTKLEVGGDTTVTDLNRRRVQIAKGTVRAAVAPQRDPLIFVTPHGEAMVLGTTLRLAVARETRLEVEEGKVELRNLESKTVIVTTGHYAVAAAGAEMTARPIRSAAAPLLE